MDREERRLIPYQRVKEEGLQFVDNEIVGDDGQMVIHSTITDAAGVVYDAVLHEDGTVGTDYCHYDSVETYQRVKGPFETLCSFTWGHKHRHHIVRDQNRDMYLYQHWENVQCSDHIEAIKTADRLAEIVFDDHDDTDHSLIFEFPKSGHWAGSKRLLPRPKNNGHSAMRPCSRGRDSTPPSRSLTQTRTYKGRNQSLTKSTLVSSAQRRGQPNGYPTVF